MIPGLGFFKGLTYFGISLEFWLRIGEIITFLMLFIGVLKFVIILTIRRVGGLSSIKKFFLTLKEKIKK